MTSLIVSEEIKSIKTKKNNFSIFRNLRFFSLFLILLCSKFYLSAAIIQDPDYNFSLDIPEGFELDECSEDLMTYFFVHPNIPVDFVLKLTDNYTGTSQKLLGENLNKLSATSTSIDSFMWNESLCGISFFSFSLDENYKGWAVTAPLQKNGSFITLLCYAPEKNNDGYIPFIMSVLNSLCIDEKYYCNPGIILAFAYPKEGASPVSLTINGVKIDSTLDATDIEAADFLVNMEYSVLTLYAAHELWKEAWQRYYRLIYRDNFGRIENCISDVLDILYPVAKLKNKQNPELELAQYLLSWVQSFDYKRNNDSPNASDFTSLPAAICGQGNDCDSRSLLVCTFMRAIGIDAILLISNEYSHAMAAVEIDAPGQKYIPAETNREFLMGETTAKVTWGMISSEHADKSRWIPVYLP
ncbi:MAG: transglutaminase-like domain-containing protein [Treponema sp.]|nr:transglutaminase-like domain-containing protein [Treponema sp.]